MDIQRILVHSCTVKNKLDTINPLTGMRDDFQTLENVKCRKFGDYKLVRNKQGEEVASTRTVILIMPVQPGDFIDDYEVKDVETCYNIDGTFSHYEARL